MTTEEDKYFESHFPKYSAEDIARFADEAEQAKREGKLLTYEQVKAGWQNKYGISF